MHLHLLSSLFVGSRVDRGEQGGSWGAGLLQYGRGEAHALL